MTFYKIVAKLIYTYYMIKLKKLKLCRFTIQQISNKNVNLDVVVKFFNTENNFS